MQPFLFNFLYNKMAVKLLLYVKMAPVRFFWKKHKYLKKNKPYIYGAISDFTGQVSVLCLNGGPTLRDIYSDEDVAQTVFPKGVVGMTPGIVGSVQALQAVKYICGFGETLVNKLWIIDLKSMESDVISV